MYREEGYPIICDGYCFFDNWDEPPSEIPVAIPYTTSDVAKSEGWTTTTSIRFSPSREAVWLCPECSERWAKENEERVIQLIEEKRQLDDEFSNCDDFYHKVWIKDIALPILIDEFESYNTTDEQNRLFYGLSNVTL